MVGGNTNTCRLRASLECSNRTCQAPAYLRILLQVSICGDLCTCLAAKGLGAGRVGGAVQQDEGQVRLVGQVLQVAKLKALCMTATTC